MARFETQIDVTEDGKVYIYNREEWIEWMKKQRPGRYYLTITNKRSLKQNNLWHKWLSMLAEFIGEEKDKLEKDLLLKVGWTEEIVDEGTGEVYKRVKGMSEANVKECREIMERVQQFVAEFYEFDLPWPDEQIGMEI